MELSLVFDTVLALLLAGTIAVALILNRRLSDMRGHQEQFETLAESFGKATSRAEDSIGSMKLAAKDLTLVSDRASSLKEDLLFLVERADKAADRLETCVRTAREVSDIPTPAPKRDTAPKKKPPRATQRPRRSEIERNLLQALGLTDAKDKEHETMRQS